MQTIFQLQSMTRTFLSAPVMLHLLMTQLLDIAQRDTSFNYLAAPLISMPPSRKLLQHLLQKQNCLPYSILERKPYDGNGYLELYNLTPDMISLLHVTITRW